MGLTYGVVIAGFQSTCKLRQSSSVVLRRFLPCSLTPAEFTGYVVVAVFSAYIPALTHTLIAITSETFYYLAKSQIRNIRMCEQDNCFK